MTPSHDTLERLFKRLDPRLRTDVTWTVFSDAYTVLVDHPEYLEDKTPEAPEGLNMNELNRLAREAGMTTGPIIELREDEDRNRYVIIHHPRVRRPVELRVYNRVPYWPGEPPSKLKRAMDNLRAWCDSRRERPRRPRLGTDRRSRPRRLPRPGNASGLGRPRRD